MAPDVTTKARRLRKDSADAEIALWNLIRGRQLLGYKFRRQVPVGRYITDFACLERNLIVELDGGQHQEQTDYDAERTRWLESQGFRVIRFWNNQVLEETDAVQDAILLALQEVT
ncbi:MAG: endonuclease domain-containing protein [Chloroflexi bacterium]|nr:endonuclease domain-containing protein [Chloroflexota bacterium]MYE39795.1 endonuclease domain-containing protein [Chloroflexota bacterium]